MFKKNLVALAVMATVSVPAFADVVITPKAENFTTTTLAAVTKQPVLSFSTAQQDVTATFSTLGDVKQNGFITLELSGDATFNAAEVRKWLTIDSTGNVPAFDGLVVSAANFTAALGMTPVTFDADGYPVDGIGLVDDQGNAITFGDGSTQIATYAALVATAGSANSATDLASADKTAAIAAADAAKTAAVASATKAAAVNGVIPFTAVAVDDMFRTENVTTDVDVISHSIDLDGQRLRLALVDRGATVNNISEVLTQKNGLPFVEGTNVQFNLDKANQIFNLKTGNSASTVNMKVGALRNASYTADPKATPDLFKLGDLFTLNLVGSEGKATALVSERFARMSTVSPYTTVDNGNVSADFNLDNITTNQSIQLNKVNLSVAGDFGGFRADTAGNLLKENGDLTGWKVANGVATRVAGDDVLAGADPAEAFDFFLSAAETNETGIEAQTFAVQATILGADQDTFNDFSSNLLDLIIIDRDGMKFDTITTGTTSANQIFVRDISKDLPATGGKIFVTITEYDAHGVNGRGEGNVLVERAELSTTLPSGGAVTLSPAEVAAEVGAAITPARQARFVFEVETNKGEVAVKKSNSEGVDIQNGTKGVETQKDGNVVDFTL